MSETLFRMEDAALQARCSPDDRAQFRQKLDTCGFVILEPRGDEELVLDEVMAQLGEPVEYSYGTKLVIEPREDAGILALSTGAMPFHTDGLLNGGAAVGYVGMKCVIAPSVGGETLVAGSAAFFQYAPEDLLEVMRGIVFEYRSRVDGYYKDGREGDHIREAPIRIDPQTGDERLFIALSDPHDPTPTLDAVIVGYSDEESTDMLCRIDAALRLPGVVYAHQWQEGEVMVLDNRRVVHGRAAFPGQPRKLIRLSVS